MADARELLPKNSQLPHLAMQLLPPLSQHAQDALREVPVGQHLPFLRHVDDHIIETRDGLLMQCIEVRGFLFETADGDELDYRKALRDAMLRAVGSSQFALYHHIVRRRIEPELAGQFPDEFSEEVDSIWQSRLARRQLYTNSLILTLVRRPLPGRLGWLDRMRQRVGGLPPPMAKQVERAELAKAANALLAALASYQPRRLSVETTSDGDFSEALAFFSDVLNGTNDPVRLPFAALHDHLPRRRISFGQDMVELAPVADRSREFVALLSIKDYPAHTSTGMFDELLRLPFEVVITQSFAFVDRGKALADMNLALRRMRSSEDEALSLRGQLTEAKDAVAAGRAAFGEHHMTVAVRGDKIADVNGAVAEIQAALAEIGIVAVREDIALEPAFWAQFPGNFKYIVRRALVSTSNFAGLSSLHNFAVGQPTGNHWGSAISLLETTAAGPYFFNFHDGDLGNFTVIGPSGSGKTVILNFLLAQARRLDPRIIFFDKDRGAELFLRATGGRYDVFRPGQTTSLNPLKLPDTAENRQFLMDWVVQLAGGADLSEMRLIKDAISMNMTQAAPMRQLRHFVELLRGAARPQPGDLWTRLQPWWGTGERSWLFDNPEDHTDFAERVVGYDMTTILDDPTVRTPAMMYLFHRIEGRLDGTPAIIIVDEGWKALDDDIFVRRIKDWEKTIRKRNGIVGFATQSAADALESRIASAIVEQAATQIFMPNPKAQAHDYIEGFGLTRHEFEIVRALPDDARCFLIKHGQESVVARLNLTGEKDLLTLLSGRESSVRLLDEVRAEVGDDPQRWMPILLERAG